MLLVTTVVERQTSTGVVPDCHVILILGVNTAVNNDCTLHRRM